VYRLALDELIQTIARLYGNAVGPEEKSDPKRAVETYDRILKMLPELRNPINLNVSSRRAAVQARIPDSK
jgi:hypothetical protein